MSNNTNEKNLDVILIGAGIMSATLGILLKKLEPDLHIHLYERLNVPGAESSDAWNNAGTGHSAFCELNYTPEKENGSIDIIKAIAIAESFEVSKQFWSFLVNDGVIKDPKNFIRKVPHFAFVHGKESVEFLRKRHKALSSHPLFSGMTFTEDATYLRGLLPLMMEGRDTKQQVASTQMDIGTDVNFGSLTIMLLNKLKTMDHVTIHYNHEVKDLKQQANKKWRLEIEDLANDKSIEKHADFVFIGAGGRALSLLEKSDIEEGKGYGGFPVSGQWLICKNKSVIEQHHAKVYGKAAIGAPPMSVPHLDTRVINGKNELLFGPYAGFSTKFLKKGSYLDLPKSIQYDNLLPMLAAGFHNISLTRYLIGQVTQSMEDRMEALRDFYPLAQDEDWEFRTAGMRVQVIKKDEKETGILEFGTEIVSSSDGSIAALLGASPGASTAVSIMIDLLRKCFSSKMTPFLWEKKLKEMIPSYGTHLADNSKISKIIRERSSEILQLNY